MNYPLTILNAQLKRNEEMLVKMNNINAKNPSSLKITNNMRQNIERQTAELKRAIRLINKKMK